MQNYSSHQAVRICNGNSVGNKSGGLYICEKCVIHYLDRISFDRPRLPLALVDWDSHTLPHIQNSVSAAVM